ncbi:MAG: hypothetical protein KDA28_16710, partial [Phycisphaerales bacterium]|nr:hypothetical protein [Phycisphaerales bacterium]
ADNPDLPELLNRLRGAPVHLQRATGSVQGTVLGVESRRVTTDDRTVDVPFVNLVTDRGIQSIDIASVSHFTILDEQLAAELNKALVALAQNRAETTKSVDLTFRGEGAREVMVAYVHEMPVWKTSYRLVLPEQVEDEDDPTLREGGMPSIHGWAIVENTTDEDWQNIELSLVAGQPVSFVMDLYEPLFMARPQVPVPTAGGVSPRVYADVMETFAPNELEVRFAETVDRSERARGLGRFAGGEMADAAPAAALEGLRSKSLDFDYAPSSMASANEVGEVFQYTIDHPVKVERQKSAMIPIVTSPIEGRRVSIYNRSDRAEHPMRGVELTNSTTLQLMPGPLAVFDGDAYAGDAQVGHIAPGDTRLLAYAVDLNVACDSSDDTRSRVEKIRIANGMLLRETRAHHDVTYKFRNKDESRARTIIVEHPKQGGWSLIQPSEPTEETDGLYRFEVELGGGDSGSLTVRTERLESQQIAITSYDVPTLE